MSLVLVSDGFHGDLGTWILTPVHQVGGFCTVQARSQMYLPWPIIAFPQPVSWIGQVAVWTLSQPTPHREVWPHLNTSKAFGGTNGNFH